MLVLAAARASRKCLAPTPTGVVCHSLKNVGILPTKMSCMSISGLIHSPSKNRGQIQVILGPMFSGKSTELMRRIKRYQLSNHECLLIKYANDTRYSDECLATHDKQTLPALKARHLNDVQIPEHCSVIGVDEGQFFSDIVEFCESKANDGIRVIVAALDGTFQRKAFDSVLDLIPLAESVIKLNAVCMICYGEAAFTKRIGSETELEVIGGTDKYMAVCRKCFKLPQEVTAKQRRAALAELSLNSQDNTPLASSENTKKTNGFQRQLLFEC